MSRLNERELVNLGLSGPMVAWFRDIDSAIQPGTRSFDISELEALLHEFRLRNIRDTPKDAAESPIYLNNPATPIKEFYALSTNISITARAFQFIAVTGNATIKLPEIPARNDAVSILNVNGNNVIVDGNGKNINGETTTTSYRKNTTINYHYFKDLDAWYMR